MVTNLITNKRYSMINAVKTVIASAIAYLVGHLLGDWIELPQMYAWIIITVLVVMSSQPNLGGALEKAKMRVIGTLMGSVGSISVILLFPHLWLAQFVFGLCLIGIGVFVATNSSKYIYVGILGAITVTIILFSSEASFSTACYRTLEVLIGITIAIAVNRYIFPIHAYKRIYQSFADAVNCIHRLNQKIFTGGDYDHVLVEVFGHFSKQITLQKEISHEKVNIDIAELKLVTRYLRQLYRYIGVIYDYVEAYPHKRQRFSENQAFKAIHDKFNEVLLKLGASFKYNDFDKTMYRQDLSELRELLGYFSESMTIQSELRHASVIMFSFKKLIDTLQAIEQTQRKIIQAQKNDRLDKKGID